MSWTRREFVWALRRGVPDDRTLTSDLIQNALVFYFFIRSQEKGFAEDDRQRVVPFERQEDLRRIGGGRTSPVRYDAEVAIVGFHQDV